MRTSLTVLGSCLLLVATLAGAGCGLKGDLYLPQEEEAAEASGGEDEDAGEQQTGSPDP